MQIDIWYFSGSGQCASMAKQVAKQLTPNYKVKLQNITSSDIREKMKEEIVAEQLLLFFPIYANDVPRVLARFLKTLMAKQVPVQLFALWGRCHKGKALVHASKILKQQGFIVNGAAELCAEHTFLLNSVPHEVEEKQILKVTEYVIGRLNKGGIMTLKKNATSPVVYLMSITPEGSIVRAVSHISLDDEMCNKCGVCKHICATGAISDDFTISEEKCIRCLACVSACPMKARTFQAKGIATKMLGKHYNENINESDCFYESTKQVNGE